MESGGVFSFLHSGQPTNPCTPVPMKLRPIVLGWILLCGLCSTPARSQSAVPIAWVEGPAPGVQAGTQPAEFRVFRAPSISEKGEVAFAAEVDTGGGIGTSNNSGIWKWTPDTFQLIAREGDFAPGAVAGTKFASLYRDVDIFSEQAPAVATSGDVAFKVGQGIWASTAGVLRPIAVKDTQVPTMPAGSMFANFSTGKLLVNDSGQINFAGSMTGPGINSTNDFAIWTESSGVYRTIIREGDEAPGLASGVTVQYASAMGFNSAGKTTVAATFVGPGINSQNNLGIWIERTGGLELVARTGQQATGQAPGVVFRDFYNVSFPLGGNYGFNSAGQVAFHADLSDNRGSIWTGEAGSIEMLISTNDPAPGMADGVEFIELGGPLINRQGRVAFEANVIGGGISWEHGSSVWSNGFGSLELIALEDARAPDTPDDVTFFGHFESLSINSFGQTAFLASLHTDDGLHDAIFAQDRQGQLRLIAREGALFEIAPGDFREVSSLTFLGDSGLDDGRPSGFNDLGQVAFQARFRNGTGGIFISNLVAVPEPTTWTLGAFGFVALIATAARRNRRALHAAR